MPGKNRPLLCQHWVWAASLAAGVIVIVWICVEMFMLSSVQFLHVLYLGWGGVIILLTRSSPVRRNYL